MPRVLILSGYWPPHVGGIERYSYSLAAELAGRSWEVDVLAAESGGERPHEAPGMRIHLYRGASIAGRMPRPTLLSAHNARLFAVLRRRRYSAVLAMSHYYVTNPLLLRMHRQVPVRVWVNHASGHVPVGENRLLAAAVQAYEHVMARIMGRLTTRAVGVSEQSARWLEHFGCDSGEILRNAVDGVSSGTDDRALTDIREVLYVGRLQPGKGSLESVEIVEAARDADSVDLRLTVVGDGPDRARLERLAADRDWLTVTGAIPSDRVYALMKRVDLLLFPSSYPEGLPTVLLEAGMHGLPVITFSVGGVRDLAPEGDELFIVDSVPTAVEVLRRLAADPLQGARRGALLRDRVLSQFTWAQTADAFEALVGPLSSVD